jgi:hypothetical protein
MAILNEIELLAQSSDLISSLQAAGAKEFTDKIHLSEKYDLVETYVYGDRFKVAVDNNLVTSFAIKMFVKKDGSEDDKPFFKYRIALRIPTENGPRYFSSDYSVGYNTKELFSQLKASEIDTDNLPIDWLYNLRVNVRKSKADGTVFLNADVINPNFLIEKMRK